MNEIRDKRKGIGILNGMFIQVAVVLAGAEVAVLFFDKEKWECLRGV